MFGFEEQLQRDGYAIVPVLNSKEVQYGLGLMWDFMEGLDTGINRKDYNTWIDKNWPRSKITGIVAEHAIGQSKFMWYSRLKSKHVFEVLYDTDDVVTSFDGMSIIRYNYPTKTWSGDKPGQWWHIDQPTGMDRCDQYQGFLNYIETDDEVGLRIIPRSHTEIYPHLPKDIDWYAEDESVNQLKAKYKMNESGITIKPPAGSFVIWDSRCLHCNIGLATSNRKALARVVAYVSMLPRSQAKMSKEKRIEWINKPYTTGHSLIRPEADDDIDQKYRSRDEYFNYDELKGTEYESMV